MTPATSDRSERGALGRPAGTPAWVRLDGWAMVGRDVDAHYLRDGRPLCVPRSVATRARLLGSLRGLNCCPACVERLGAVAP